MTNTPTERLGYERLRAKHESYMRNRHKELAKSAERTRRLRAAETEEQATLRKERHREAQARYRKKNWLMLSRKACEARMKKKMAKDREADEEEYQALMALADEV